jgi:hypothetical protein
MNSERFSKRHINSNSQTQMSRLCYFFATKEDLLTITRQIESSRPIKYVRFGHVVRLPPETLYCAEAIPNFGVASNRTAVACDKYLVCDIATTLAAESLRTLSAEDVDRAELPHQAFLRSLIGIQRFSFSQLLNPDTVAFNPGGLWNNEVLLHGAVSTASETEVSLALMKAYRSAIKKKFVRVRSFYVGPQALALLQNGMRLTISVDSPKEFDLRI